jgi:polyisoprenoid-binding protein YceI
MKKKNLIKWIGIASIMIITSVEAAQAQQRYELNKDETSISIQGTSNLHDWKMEAEDIKGFAISILKNGSIDNFKNARITVDVEDIESGKRIMNNKTYEALKSEKHPQITFELESIKDFYAAGTRFSGKATGTLTIAGESRNVSIPFNGKLKNNGNHINISGDYSLKMTSYNVDPPTAMLGSLTTGDKVTVAYNITLIK